MTPAHHALDDPARTLRAILRTAPCLDLGLDAVRTLLPDHDPASVDAALVELVAADLLHRDGPADAARFRVPDVLRAERTADPDVTADLDVTAAHLRLVEHYMARLTAASETLEPGKFAFSEPPGPAWTPPDRVAARAWVDAEWITVVACQRLADDLGYDDLVWGIGERLWILLRSAGLFDAVLDTQQLAASARRLEHPYASAAHARICWALLRLGRHAEAVQAGEQALALALAVMFDHAWSKATAWSQLGRAHHATGAPDLALTCLHRAEAEDTSPTAKGLRRRHRDEVRHSTGDLAGAEADFRAALELIGSTPRPRLPETARVLVLLAGVLLEQDRAREAVEELGEAVLLLDPDADTLYLAEVELHLGHALLACGEHDSAASGYLRAAALFDRASHPQRADDARARHTAIGGVD
ncbi:hypothetical protein [Saccharothrix sp. Mg75]|uniref:hypothetical protein n=1 Tax=Saccharothrix sp. Mg75 TaxID=3445357 RepID=UPI003EED48E4